MAVDLFLWKNPDTVLQLKEKEEQLNKQEEFEEEVGGTYINPATYNDF